MVQGFIGLPQEKSDRFFRISKVELYSLRSQLGFVPQDCMLFEGTIFSNIAISDPQVSSDRIVKVAKLACAHDFIMSCHMDIIHL